MILLGGVVEQNNKYYFGRTKSVITVLRKRKSRLECLASCKGETYPDIGLVMLTSHGMLHSEMIRPPSDWSS